MLMKACEMWHLKKVEGKGAIIFFDFITTLLLLRFFSKYRQTYEADQFLLKFVAHYLMDLYFNMNFR